MGNSWDNHIGITSKFGGTGVFDRASILDHFDKKQKSYNNEYYVSPRDSIIAAAEAFSEKRQKHYLEKTGPHGTWNSPQLGGHGNTLMYPSDIDVKQDHIEIDEYAYARPKGKVNDKKQSSQNAAGPGATTKSGKKIGGTIILPMPKATDASGAEWGKGDLTGDEMNRSSRASGYKGLFRRREGLDRGQENADAYGQDYTEGEGGTARSSRRGTRYWWGRELALRAKTASKNIGGNVSASSLLFRERGQILNPNAELLFQGPSLRSFDFNWLMVARSQKEGVMIREIIRKLKLGAAPKWNNTMLLEVPSIWQITYKRGSEDLKTVNKFKECALVSLTADYAPDGIWSAYEDSQPIALRMGLSFKELRAVYNTDQKETHQQSVGF